MKIAMLASGASIHTVQWLNGLSEAGHYVHLITQHSPSDQISDLVSIHKMPFVGMPGYYLNRYFVKKILEKIEPDILNAHYASGYGTTARLVGFHPYVLSVWGSDVYDFPYKSGFHKKLIQKNLKASDSIASTSVCMAGQTRELMQEDVDIAITPFGVNIDNFAVKRTHHNPYITIGTVKTLASKYGIDTLIQAFAIVRKKLNEYGTEIDVNLKIVGDGPQRRELESMTASLGLHGSVQFVGSVPHNEVPNILREIDIFVALSRYESFGVAVIEAGAASLPVVVSDVGGLPEVTLDGVTGFLVNKDDPQDAAEKLVYLCQNDVHREQMGEAGYLHVSDRYNWPICIKNMLDAYENAIDKARV